MLAVKINNLSYQINNNDILQNVNLELEQDKIACVLGPSGCGKTTMLKLIAGLDKVQSGEIYLHDNLVSSINKHIKTEKRKEELEKRKQETVRELKKHVINIENLVSFQNHIVNAKLEILKKLNSVRQLTDTFIKTSNGYKVTTPEGYVAIDRISGNAVKLVDRMEFSFNNFTAIKSWDK